MLCFRTPIVRHVYRCDLRHFTSKPDAHRGLVFSSPTYICETILEFGRVTEVALLPQETTTNWETANGRHSALRRYVARKIKLTSRNIVGGPSRFGREP